MASHFTVLYDSCVLYPAPLRDLLMHLAIKDLYRAKWTDMIHDEWTNAILRVRPELSQALKRTRLLMNQNVRDCLVTGFEDLIDGLELPDPNDRHVLAAAIRCNADVILTYNLKDFPEDELVKFGIEAQHPDQFLEYQITLAPSSVCEAAKSHRASLKNPPKSVDEYFSCLESQSLPQTVARLREFSKLI